jgi:hypothetical protein
MHLHCVVLNLQEQQFQTKPNSRYLQNTFSDVAIKNRISKRNPKNLSNSSNLTCIKITVPNIVKPKIFANICCQNPTKFISSDLYKNNSAKYGESQKDAVRQPDNQYYSSTSQAIRQSESKCEMQSDTLIHHQMKSDFAHVS